MSTLSLPHSLRHLRDRDQGDRSLRNLGDRFVLEENVYTHLDRYCLLDAIAKGARATYVNFSDVLQEYDREPQGKSPSQIFHERFSLCNERAVLDGLGFTMGDDPNMNHLQWAFQQLAWMAHKHPHDMPKRIIMPLILSQGGKHNHGHMMLAALEWDKDANNGNGQFTLSLFEQHAYHDSHDPEYDEERTYGPEIRQIEKTAKESLPLYGITLQQVKLNKEPYCRRKMVCGVATLAAAKTVLFDKRAPSALLDELDRKDVKSPSPLLMSHDDVTKAHGDNVELLKTIAEHDAGAGQKSRRGVA